MVRGKWRMGLALLVVLAAVCLPRLPALDRFLTADEPGWLARSANFYCALGQGDYAGTRQRHPGVTAMWAGSAAFLQQFPGYFGDCVEQSDHKAFGRFLQSLGADPVQLLARARAVMVLANAAALGLAFLFAWRLLGPLPAFVGFLLIALSPFHVALSRLLHLDALLASLMLLALLAYMDFLRRRRLLSLLVAGAAAGLSWLTKTPALFLVPFVGLLTALDLWRRRRAFLDTPAAVPAVGAPLAAPSGAVAAAPGSAPGDVAAVPVVGAPLAAPSAVGEAGARPAAPLPLSTEGGTAPRPVSAQDDVAAGATGPGDVAAVPVVGAPLAAPSGAAPLQSGFSLHPSAFILFQAAWPLLVWGLTALLVVVLLWPSLWFQPLDTLAVMADQAGGYAAEGHSTPLFFNGVVAEDGRLGLNFFYFYPLTYLWRSTPIVLLGLLATLLAFLFRRGPLAQAEQRRAAVALALYAALFALFLTLSAKKFDRYLLPATLALDLVAGLGLVAAARWLLHLFLGRPPEPAGPFVVTAPAVPERAPQKQLRQTRPARAAAILLLLAALIAAHALAVAQTFPYYLSYYNPLLGGAARAPAVMMVGWGEGLDEVARYFNAKEDRDSLSLFTWYDTSFSYFFDGRGSVLRIPDQVEWEEATMKQVLNADYAVIYIHQWQRRSPAQLLDFLATKEPEQAIWIDGLEYARIYRLDAGLNIAANTRPLAVAFGPDIWLEGYSLPAATYRGGEMIPLTLFWRALAQPAEWYQVFVHLLDEEGALLAQGDSTPVGGFYPTVNWQAGETIEDHYGVFLPESAPPGRYTLQVGMYPPSGERLLLSQAGRPLGDSLLLAEITIEAP